MTKFDLFVLDRHDIATELPVAIRGIVQKGLMQRAFEEALRPEFLYSGIADVAPWMGAEGDEKIWTRTGLMTPSPTPVSAGSDATAGSYSKETWSSIMAKYGKSLDTNMLASEVAISSSYLNDVKTLGIHAGQSMNMASRDTIHSAYAGGRTWATSASTTSTALVVNDVNGFGFTSVYGVLTAVSATNPLAVTVNGVANTVTAVSASTGAGTLTLGTAISASIGHAVVAANAPVSIRPSGATPYNMTSSDMATLAMFRAGRARLRKMNVPAIGGAYTAFISEDTLAQLYADTSFNNALQGNIDSPVWRDMAIGRINGIDFVPTNDLPTILGGSAGTLQVNRTLMVGGGALMWCPLAGLGSLLGQTGLSSTQSIISPTPGFDIQLITRPPQDRFQDVVTTTWKTVGGFGVPTDLMNASNDAALYKRAVMLEHA